VTSFTVATAANYADSERLQGDTASNKDAAPQHELQFIDYIEHCQSRTAEHMILCCAATTLSGDMPRFQAPPHALPIQVKS
jgi:hypothetical protein